jgi:hypothetical protein
MSTLRLEFSDKVPEVVHQPLAIWYLGLANLQNFVSSAVHAQHGRYILPTSSISPLSPAMMPAIPPNIGADLRGGLLENERQV